MPGYANRNHPENSTCSRDLMCEDWTIGHPKENQDAKSGTITAILS